MINLSPVFRTDYGTRMKSGRATWMLLKCFRRSTMLASGCRGDRLMLVDYYALEGNIKEPDVALGLII